MKKLIFFIFLVHQVSSQEIIPLYSSKAPGLKDVTVQEENISKEGEIIRLRNVTVPTLKVYTPKSGASETGVVICPGGGYYILAYDHEGEKLGEWFAEKGITAFVLKYRLPQSELFENSSIRPLQDVQQSFRIIRKNAEKWGIKNLGIMGFSAGGHLAATASTKFTRQVGETVDNSLSVRPDFSILIYPVISFEEKIGHSGSKENLLGKNPSHESVMFYSAENHVSENTPPTLLVHAFDDRVRVENSLVYAQALSAKNIPVEFHGYQKGGHGFGLVKKGLGPVEDWPLRMEDWLKNNGWMP